MSDSPIVTAVITGRLNDYTREALRAVVDEAGPDIKLRYEPCSSHDGFSAAVAAAPPEPLCPSIADLIAAVSFETGVSSARIIGDGRCRPEIRARFAVCWAAREQLGASASAIGRALSDRDHSTILQAWRRAEQMIGSDPAFRMLIDRTAAALERRR